MEEKIHNLRKNYIHIQVPTTLEHEGWNNVRSHITQIEQGKKVSSSFSNMKRIAFTVSFILFLGICLVSLVQVSHPGNTLYGAKVFSQNIVAYITGNYQPIIENRGQDILDISQNDPNRIDQAVREYNNALNESTHSATESAQHKQIVQTIKKQEKAFQQAIQKDPQLENKLQPAINKAQEIVGNDEKDVKGIHILPSPADNSHTNINHVIDPVNR